MKKIFFFFLLILFVKISYSQHLKHKELLGRPTNNSVTIQAFFDTIMDVSIKYGTAPDQYTNQTPFATFNALEPAEIVINGLQENTKYFYRMTYKLPGSTNIITRPEFTFQTQRPVGSIFSFVVQADPHMDEQSDTALYRRTLLNQLEDHPDFMIDLGDFLMTDKLKNSSNAIPHDTIPYRCKILRNFYEISGHSVPLFIALGNHEGESGWNRNNTPENIAVWNTNERKKYFMNPIPGNFFSGDTSNQEFVGQRENYYSWKWGDALFIVIDPYWYTNVKPDSLHGWRWTLGKPQYDWLKTTLENDNSKYKFVFSHQIVGGDPDGRGGVEFADLYEWGGNNLDGTYGFETNRPGWYKPIKDLLTEHHVSIFFHGHDHFFGQQQKDCLVYQETPQPSHPNFMNANYAADYGYTEGVIIPNSGHLKITVGPDEAKVEYERAYLPQNENGTRHNKDISATYFVKNNNCYDSLTANAHTIWNSDYKDELIYPNPFSDKTKIEFTLANSERISLYIYNENGELISKLIDNSNFDKGTFQLFWDGTNTNGKTISNGVYFYSLIGEKSTNKKGKIILTK
jgi:hypothetical protein